MRMQVALLLALGPWLSACGDSGGPSEGTLLVATSTAGENADRDGYQLVVDSGGFFHLAPAGTFELDLSPGRHGLTLLGVADQCSVAPGAAVAVEVASRATTSVAFEVNCPATGARVNVTTTGLDFDTDFYRVVVDGTDQGAIAFHGTLLTRLDPGSRTIGLTDLPANCAVDGPESRTVTIVAREVALVEFAVICTATSGVIGVFVEASGPDVDGQYQPLVDGQSGLPARARNPAYLAGVSPGDHVVSLVAPDNCSVMTDPQPVTLKAGGLVRDTVEVTFSVTCVPRISGTLRITAPTTGSIPTTPYTAWICREQYGCPTEDVFRLLGELEPNGTLVTNPVPGLYQLNLRDIPEGCSVQPSVLSRKFTIRDDVTRTIEFQVTCSR